MGAAQFLSFDPMELARQLTRVDYDLCQKIKPLDFAEYIWMKDKPDATIDGCVNRFNQVSYWVGTEVCTTPLLKNRIAVLENLIKILRGLKELNNFNGVMAVISGLNMASIRRLKKTWEGISPKLAQTLHEIESIMDPQFNYQAYREYESRFMADPFIPFLGLYLKDLTFANDGNPKMLENGLINFTKNWSIFEIIGRIKNFQSRPMVVEDNGTSAETYEYCMKLIALPEKRLYNYSLLCEPRKASSETGKKDDGANDSVRLIEKWAK